MGTTEGGALVEDNKSSGVGERGSQPRMQAYKKEGSTKHIRGCSSVPEKLKLQIRELDARQRGKVVLLATQEKASRASREPVDEEETMAQAWWEGAREPGEPIGTK
ncbi:hypothetical protein R1flu_000115 [Riccia fluitans]|uniref:Uncharacterized protein n=1 Tax=Riccia fluitans TaxID=41844 RepID=A0ABD1XZY7_9MARC